jgi:TldD protein
VDDEAAGRVVGVLLGKGADAGELFFEDAVRGWISTEDGKLKDMGCDEDAGCGLRAVQGETTAYGYVQSFDPGEMKRVAAQVAQGAVSDRRLVAVTPAGLLPLRRGLYRTENPSVLLPPTGKVELIRRADAAARAYSPLVARVDIALVEEYRTIGLYSSRGVSFVDHLPMLRFNVTVIAQKEGRRQQGYAAGGGRVGLEYFDARSPEDVAREAARIAVEMLDARAAPAGEQTVVLAPADSGVLLHEAVGHGLEADFNRKGTSKYAGRVGEMVASKLCTVVDDGTLPRSRGSIAVDDEGSPSGRSVLIEKGKLVGYMHDAMSAGFFKVSPSGNGRRQSYRFPPMPRMTNTFMMPGESSPDEILRSTSKGIYCRTFSGGQVNISNGDFVFQVVESYLIEEGKLTAPLKDVIIIGNGPDALSRVVMVGSDLTHSDGRWTCGKSDQQVPVGVGIPTVKIEGITVGGQA